MADYDVAGVTALINSYMEAYNNRNIEALSDLVANDDTLVGFGTDKGESWVGWNTYRNVTEKQFAAIDEIHWDRQKPMLHFSSDGNVAWFSEEFGGKFQCAGEEHTCAFRMTGVVEKRQAKWVIVQFHRSCPVEEFAVPYLETHGVRFD